MRHSHDHDHSHSHGHDHDHDHGSHEHGPSPRSALWKAIAVTSVFMVIELAGGFVSNSLALITDGLHMGADVAALVFSLFAIWVSGRPKTPRMSYGYHRAEILGALASGLGIWLISGLLVWEAVQRLQEPPHVMGGLMLVIAAIGLAANLISMKMLHGAHTHNMNVRAAYLHVLSDAIGSIAAVIGGVIIYFTGWQLADPIITLIAAALMLYSSWALVKEAVTVLMESTPSGVDPELVHRDLSAVAGVREVHDLHIWAVAKGRLALSVHIVAQESEESILTLSNKVLERNYGIIHTTIQVEHPERFASERCYDCTPRS